MINERRDLNSPGTLVQFFCLGGVLFLAGLLGLFGLFGDDAGPRVLGALIAALALAMQGLAIYRFRRQR